MGEVLAHRFELLQLIAQGGSGDVWVAFDRHAKKLCAAKVCRQRDTPNLLRFVREQGVSFSHPHVITPYGWSGNDTDVVIASDLVAGGTLAQALRNQGVFTPPLAAEVVLQLSRGLHHVHGEGWVHRDVKPANVLLEATGTGHPVARLSDFGSAVRSDDVRLTHTGYIHGTLGYMPPEVYRGGDPTPAMDWFALGVVGLRLMHQFRPNQKLDPRGYIDQVPMPDVLARTLRGLLSTDPDERVATAQSLDTVLGSLAAQGVDEQGTAAFMTASGAPFQACDQLGLEELSTTNPSVPSEAFASTGQTAVSDSTRAATKPFSAASSAGPAQSPTAPFATSVPDAVPAPPVSPNTLVYDGSSQSGSPAFATAPTAGRTPVKSRRIPCGLLAPIGLILTGVAAVIGALALAF